MFTICFIWLSKWSMRGLCFWASLLLGILNIGDFLCLFRRGVGLSTICFIWLSKWFGCGFMFVMFWFCLIFALVGSEFSYPPVADAFCGRGGWRGEERVEFVRFGVADWIGRGWRLWWGGWGLGVSDGGTEGVICGVGVCGGRWEV